MEPVRVETRLDGGRMAISMMRRRLTSHGCGAPSSIGALVARVVPLLAIACGSSAAEDPAMPAMPSASGAGGASASMPGGVDPGDVDQSAPGSSAEGQGGAVALDPSMGGATPGGGGAAPSAAAG